MPKAQKKARSILKGNKAAPIPLEEDPRKQGRRFMFTHNNYTKDSIEFWKSFDYSYIVFGEEVGSKKGTPHLQGYLETPRKTCISSIHAYFRKSFRDRYPAAPEGREVKLPGLKHPNGSYLQNKIYCSKDAKNVVELGEPMKQGVRTDIIAICKELTVGTLTLDTLLEEQPLLWWRYQRLFEKTVDRALSKLKRTKRPEVFWFYGPTGTGKTHTAHTWAISQKEPYYVFKKDHGWWDDYTGEGIVILEDFRGEIEWAELLQLTDKNTSSVSRRGRARIPFVAHTIIITTPLTPDEIYEDKVHHKDKMEQIHRRIRLMKEFTEKYEEKVVELDEKYKTLI